MGVCVCVCMRKYCRGSVGRGGGGGGEDGGEGGSTTVSQWLVFLVEFIMGMLFAVHQL